MKLIIESNRDVHCLTEEVGGKKRFFIEGVFMQSEIENRNNRIYPKSVLESSVNKYIETQIKPGRAVGELNHPSGPSINLDKVSHKIESLKFSGNNVIGKAMILNTPMGQIAQGLLEGGVQLGVSSRGMGGIREESGKQYIKEGFILTTVDIVQDPSAPRAFVNGIMEGVEYIVSEDGTIEEYIDGIKKRITKTPSKQLMEQQIIEFTNFMTFLKGKS